MVCGRFALPAYLVIGISAWPNLLECGDDSYSRLTVHSTIMGGKVKACEEGSCPASITLLPGDVAGTTTVRITTTGIGNFAVRVNDGAGNLSSTNKDLKNTVDCPRQMVSDPGTPVPMFPGKYDVIFTPAMGKTVDDAVFSVGFAAGAALPGVFDAVKILTYPPTPQPPAPAPKPKGTPEMKLLLKGNCSQPATLKTLKEGTYSFHILVLGEKGFEHNCSSVYDPAQGVTDKDCIDWLPSKVLKTEEPLDISLQALDVDGKQKICMRWALSFDAEKSEKPAMHFPLRVEDPVSSLHNAMRSSLSSHPVPNYGNKSRQARIASMNNYLDAMSYVSHRCVPKGEPKYLPIPLGFPPVFPPNAFTEEQIRLSHALMASTGTVWSIDRACLDAWYIDGKKQPVPGGAGWEESCVPQLPGFPHCHVNCAMTWRLGPSGVASWGLFSLSHHIPAPGIALITQGALDEAKYNNTGCGHGNTLLV